jgi:hypothetical protein
MAGDEPTVWRVEIAPEEFKLFGDCNRDELEAAAGLIQNRAASRGFSAGGQPHDDAVARRRLMRLTDQERRLLAVVEMIKIVEEQQTKGRDA